MDFSNTAAMKLGFLIYTGWFGASIVYGIIGGGIKYFIARQASLGVHSGSPEGERK